MTLGLDAYSNFCWSSRRVMSTVSSTAQKPSDLPVQASTKYELAINLRLLIKVIVAGSSIAMQSHNTFPLGVQTTSAR